jgi:uncharacterized protein YmfQ (DUF2313 family)
MKHAELLKRLLPPVAYDPNAPLISAELEAEGAALDAANSSADLLLVESDPRTTSQLLPDFERVLGLPDSCCGTDAASTIGQRRARVVEKSYAKGGQSRPFFINLAARLGYNDVSISEFRPMTCEDPCDRPVYGADWCFAWQMNIGDYFAIHSMTCEDPCDSPLRSWQQSELLCRINQLKPAHTLALVNWTMTQEQIDVVVAYGRDDILAGAPVLHALLNTTLPSASYW